MRGTPGTFAKAAPPRAVFRKSQSIAVLPTRAASAARPRPQVESAAATATPPPSSPAPPPAAPEVVPASPAPPQPPASKPVQPSDAVTVVCRVRPLGAPSPEGSLTVGCTQVDHDSTGLTIVPDGELFTFDRIFRAGSTQQEVFDAIGAPVLQSILDGFNGCVLAYGQVRERERESSWLGSPPTPPRPNAPPLSRRQAARHTPSTVHPSSSGSLRAARLPRRLSRVMSTSHRTQG